MCGHTFVYSPPVRAVKGILEREELGEIFFVSSSRVNLGLHQPDVSVSGTSAPTTSPSSCTGSRSCRRKCAQPVAIRSSPESRTSPSSPSATRRESLANVELSWLAPTKLRRTVIVGSRKMIVYEDGTSEPVRVFDHGVIYKDPETFGEHHLSYRTGDILSPKVESYEPLVKELEDFVHAVGNGGETVANAGLARDVVRITESVDTSLQRGGVEVAVTPGRFTRARNGLVIP